MNAQKKFGFIGCGNMGGAIITGILKNRVVDANNICVFDVSEAMRTRAKNDFGVQVSDKLADTVEFADIVFFCVKPNIIASVLKELKDGGKSFVSIVAGWSSKKIEETYGKPINVLRIMPNTPLLVGQGMTVFELPTKLPEEDFKLVERIFSSLGKVSSSDLAHMDAVTAVSGSGPAYAYMLINAMADGGVLQGLPKDQALLLAAQTVLGAAQVVLETKMHPMQLRDNVCSPAGTTIEAVAHMENQAFDGIVIEAVSKCAKKSKELG